MRAPAGIRRATAAFCTRYAVSNGSPGRRTVSGSIGTAQGSADVRFVRRAELVRSAAAPAVRVAAECAKAPTLGGVRSKVRWICHSAQRTSAHTTPTATNTAFTHPCAGAPARPRPPVG